MRLVEVLNVVACDVVLRLLVVDSARRCNATDILQRAFIRPLRWRRVTGIVVMFVDLMKLRRLLHAAADI